MAAKRIRWECPHGLHPGVLASSRPRKNATARYCLPCSEEAGVLVERTAPALERKRNAKAAVREQRAQAQRENEQRARELAHKVPVIDAAGNELVLDAGELLARAWKTRELRSQQRDAWRHSKRLPPVPELVVRRGTERAQRARINMERGDPIRLRDAMSGHAAYAGDRIVVTCGPGLGEEWLRAIMVHEAAHAACPLDTRHGARWRSAYVRAVRELYPEVELAPLPELDPRAWRLDEQIAEAIYGCA